MQHIKHNLKLNTSAGFSIVETLVAVTIFSFALVGIISVSAGGLTSATASRNTLIAKYLAQEGIESVRYIRDDAIMESIFNNTDQNIAWGKFLSTINNTGTAGKVCEDLLHGCNIDLIDLISNSTSVKACSNQSTVGCPIRVNSSSGYYGNLTSSSPLSGFNRKITIDTSITNIAIVTSTVTWQQGFNTPFIKMTETLFNWKY